MNRPQLIEDPAYHCLREDNPDGYHELIGSRRKLTSRTPTSAASICARRPLQGGASRCLPARRRPPRPGPATPRSRRLLAIERTDQRHLLPGQYLAAGNRQQRPIRHAHPHDVLTHVRLQPDHLPRNVCHSNPAPSSAIPVAHTCHSTANASDKHAISPTHVHQREYSRSSSLSRKAARFVIA